MRHCGDMGYGPRRAREKLREKGVPQELWDEALDELAPGRRADRPLSAKQAPRPVPGAIRRRSGSTDALLRPGFSLGRGEVRLGPLWF
ncbi:MAG: RecX family transcriptional regulator [Dysosmobacter sp.]